MPRALCIQCTSSEEELLFPTVKELNEHIKSGHKIMPIVEAPKPVEVVKTPDNPPGGTPVSEKKPIILEYRYKGTCEICNGELDTIKVSVGEKDMMIAYCPTDRKQWTSQEVIPIGKQLLRRVLVNKKTGVPERFIE